MNVKMKKTGACVLVGCMAVALIMPTATTTAQAAKIKLNKTKVYILKGESVKLKIKGIKRSFYFYIGLCVLVTILLTVIEVLTEETNVFSKIFSMLCGAGA